LPLFYPLDLEKAKDTSLTFEVVRIRIKLLKTKEKV